MFDRRGALEVEDLLKIVLALVVVLLALQIVEWVLETTLWFLNALPTILGIVVVALIVLWLADRI